MIFGYTPFDPFVVIFGVILALRYLVKNAPKLIGLMPTALSIWFFVPSLNRMTLWQAIPLMLTFRTALRGSIKLPKMASVTFFVLAPCIAFSFLFAILFGADQSRAIIRVIYYTSLLALFSFSYEMGLKPESHELLLKGFAIMGIVYGAYGLYQVLAFYTGLPVRGVVYSASGHGIIPVIQGIPRVNSLANEPKRLGYVMFLAALACVFLARVPSQHSSKQLYFAAIAIISVSVMTFSSSYFVAMGFFAASSLLMKPSKSMGYLIAIVGVAILIMLLLPNLGVLQAITDAYNSRSSEFEVGIDNSVVYRQEFFAWDYIENNPLAVTFGVGVGQYFSVLNSEYGPGVGYGLFGELAPLNSNFLELVFDFGAVAVLAIYGSLAILILKLRKSGELFYCYGLLFLLCQSFTILTLLYIMLLSGLAMGKLAK